MPRKPTVFRGLGQNQKFRRLYSRLKQAWAWAIYRGADHFLITRSQAEYRERAEALDAGIKAAETIGQWLHVEIVKEEVS